jgi:hypothetical protein
MARIDDIAYAVMKQEGSVYLDTLQPKPGSVNHTMVTTRGLWNVGHINWAKQNGAIAVVLKPGGREWAGWPTFQQAYQGLINQIKLDANRGDTITTFVKDYAPGADGNVESTYVKGMVDYLGVPANTKLSDIIAGAPTSNPTPAPPEKPNLEGLASSPTSNSPLPPPTSGAGSTNTSPVPPPSSVPPLEPPSPLSWWQRLWRLWWYS